MLIPLLRSGLPQISLIPWRLQERLDPVFRVLVSLMLLTLVLSADGTVGNTHCIS
jgi:Tfp pilus assembly protein PilN